MFKVLKKTPAELAELFDVHPNQITNWKAQLLEGAAGVFGAGAASPEATPRVDLKALHAKIGELALENDFDIQFDDDELPKLTSLPELVAAVERHVSTAS